MTRLWACLLGSILLCASAAADIRQITLPTNDIVYDPATRKIYASVPGSAGRMGNTITAIDPATAAVGPSFFAGSEPGKLALTEDGYTLYAAVDGGTTVRRFDLMPSPGSGPEFSATPTLEFPLGKDPKLVGHHYEGDG